MYLIIGASGYLGRYCIKNVLEKTGEKIISTYSEKEAFVFRHEHKFKEADKYNPVNMCGRHKALAEQIVLTHWFNFAPSAVKFSFEKDIAEIRPLYYASVGYFIDIGMQESYA